MRFDGWSLLKGCVHLAGLKPVYRWALVVGGLFPSFTWETCSPINCWEGAARSEPRVLAACAISAP